MHALETLVNGDRKLGLLDLTDLSRSFTSIYQLLPIFPCLGNADGALIRLSEAGDIPCLNQAQRDRILAAERFHRDIEKAAESNQAFVGPASRGTRSVRLWHRSANQPNRDQGGRRNRASAIPSWR